MEGGNLDSIKMEVDAEGSAERWEFGFEVTGTGTMFYMGPEAQTDKGSVTPEEGNNRRPKRLTRKPWRFCDNEEEKCHAAGPPKEKKRKTGRASGGNAAEPGKEISVEIAEVNVEASHSSDETSGKGASHDVFRGLLDIKEYYCTCHRKFASMKKLSNHVRTNQVGRNFHCPHCAKRFSFWSKVREHAIRVHKLAMPAARGCRECGLCFSTAKELFSHQMDIHNNGPLLAWKKYAPPIFPKATPHSEEELEQIRSEMKRKIAILTYHTLITETLANEALQSLNKPPPSKKTASLVEVKDEDVQGPFKNDTGTLVNVETAENVDTEEMEKYEMQPEPCSEAITDEFVDRLIEILGLDKLLEITEVDVEAVLKEEPPQE